MKYALPILLLLCCLACNKEESDNIQPEIMLMNVFPRVETVEVCGKVQHNVLQLSPNGQLKIQFKVSDNQMLSHYKVHLAQDASCQPNAMNQQYLSLFYQVEDKVNVFSTEENIEINWRLMPYALPGNYILNITAIDIEGNESAESIAFKLIVKPVISSIHDGSTNDNVGDIGVRPIKDGLAIINARLAMANFPTSVSAPVFINMLQVDIKDDQILDGVHCIFTLKSLDNTVIRSYYHTVHNINHTQYNIPYHLPFEARDSIYGNMKLDIQVMNTNGLDSDAYTLPIIFY